MYKLDTIAYFAASNIMHLLCDFIAKETPQGSSVLVLDLFCYLVASQVPQQLSERD